MVVFIDISRIENLSIYHIKIVMEIGEAFRINFLFLIFKRNLEIMLPERVESVEAGGVMASTPCQL